MLFFPEDRPLHGIFFTQECLIPTMKVSDKPVVSPKTDCTFCWVTASPKRELRPFCSTIQTDVRSTVSLCILFLLLNADSSGTQMSLNTKKKKIIKIFQHHNSNTIKRYKALKLHKTPITCFYALKFMRFLYYSLHYGNNSIKIAYKVWYLSNRVLLFSLRTQWLDIFLQH